MKCFIVNNDYVLPNDVPVIQSEKYQMFLSDEDFNGMIAVKLYSGYRRPLDTMLTATTGPITPMDEIGLRARSSLGYTVNETVSSELYWHFNSEDINGERIWYFTLMFQYVPCYVPIDDELTRIFETALKTDMGVLVCDTMGFAQLPGADWYVRECFRDIIDQMETSGQLIEGKRTGHLYFFINSIDPQEINELAEQFRNNLIQYSMLQIFPKNTPARFIETRKLQPMNNGQWKAPEYAPNDLDLTVDILTAEYTLQNISELFWMITLLSKIPNYESWQDDLKYHLLEGNIRVILRTELIDVYLMVKTASRVAGQGNVILSYDLSKVADEAPIAIFDLQSNKMAYLALTKS